MNRRSKRGQAMRADKCVFWVVVLGSLIVAILNERGMKMIYKQVSFADFSAEFEKFGRKDQFSPSALELIFNYLDNDDVDQRLDVIAICCDFSEAPLAEVANEYGVPSSNAREYLENSTAVLGETEAKTIVYLNF